MYARGNNNDVCLCIYGNFRAREREGGRNKGGRGKGEGRVKERERERESYLSGDVTWKIGKVQRTVVNFPFLQNNDIIHVYLQLCDIILLDSGGGGGRESE